MKPFALPIIPNSPVRKSSQTVDGMFQLKSFGNFGFVQNVAFDETLISFDDNYQNDQSNSWVFKQHMNDVYSLIKSNFSEGSKLVEVGCGKGAFLEIVKADGYFDYAGYDAAYEGNDEKIKARYVNENDRIKADIVVMRHSLDYIKAPHTFLKMLGKTFSEGALIFIEVPQFDWIEEHKVLFDFTYERPSYFSTVSLCSLFTDVKHYGNFFGGQYQYCLAKLGSLDTDKWKGFDLVQSWSEFNFDLYWQSFSERTDFLSRKQRIWIWGGGNKGVLLIKHLSDMSPNIFQKIVSVVDIDKKKQALYTPSTNLPIISPKQMFSQCEDSDFVLVVNPNYLNEVRENLEKNVPFPISAGTI